MQLYFNIAVFIFGLLVGSFLNCVIYRLEHKQSFLKGRSFCPKCKRVLQWYDLIPVLSYVFLKGKCRHCHKKISVQYPLVEIATGILFLISCFLFLNHFSFLIFYWLIFSLLIIIFVYDLKHYIIPDKVVFPAIALVLVFRIWDLFRISNLGFRVSRPFEQALLSACCVSFFFFAIWLLSRGRAMGFGDVKLVFLLGLLLGWPAILVGLFLAFLSGALVGIFLIVFKKKGLKSQVPFGPFLILGAFLALFWGEYLWQGYMRIVQ